MWEGREGKEKGWELRKTQGSDRELTRQKGLVQFMKGSSGKEWYLIELNIHGSHRLIRGK